MTPAELNNLLRKYTDNKYVTHEATKELDDFIKQVGLLDSLNNSKESKLCLAVLSCLFEEDEKIDLKSLKSVLSSLWRAISNEAKV